MKTRIAEQSTDYERGTFSENVGNYLDYFLSQEALPTRVIAFTSSLVVTGGKTALDVSAERKKLFQEEMAADGLFRELKRRRFYEKPSVKKKAKEREAARRRQKWLAKRTFR